MVNGISLSQSSKPCLEPIGLSVNQKNVAAVFEELKEELDNHHDKHAIGSRHNRRRPNLGKIKESINLN